MTEIMNQGHITARVADYLLELLPEIEQRQIERHVVQCDLCRSEVDSQRHMIAAVRQTVQSATTPPPGRMAALRPSGPRRSLSVISTTVMGLAPVTVVVLLLVVGLIGQVTGRSTLPGPGLFNILGTEMAPTATATDLPTATIASTDTGLPLHATIMSTRQPDPVSTDNLDATEVLKETPAPTGLHDPDPTPVAALVTYNTN